MDTTTRPTDREIAALLREAAKDSLARAGSLAREFGHGSAQALGATSRYRRLKAMADALTTNV